jgi:hypothetical protein
MISRLLFLAAALCFVVAALVAIALMCRIGPGR